MKWRTLLLLTLALVIAGGAAYMARSWLLAERAQLAAREPTTTVIEQDAASVLVVRQDVPAGTFIKPEHLDWLPWPEDGVLDAYVEEGERTVDDYRGAVARSTIAAGQPVTDALIVHPGDRGFLAAVLEPGFRAVSVPVNATSGISGFIFPGDRVDLLMTMRVRSDDGEGQKDTRHLSETLLNGIRVLAIDQKVENLDGDVRVAETATLEVTPKEAEKVALALDMGALSLSLHSLARDGQAEGSADDEEMGATNDTPRHSVSYTLDMDVLHARHDPRLFPTGTQAGTPVYVLRGSETETARF